MKKEIEEMNKAVKCLAIAVPEPVYETFSAVWNALRDSLLTPPADVQDRAKGAEDLYRIARKAVADRIKKQGVPDELTPLLTGIGFDMYLAGASSVSGMQWVKASERLPEANKGIPIKVTNDIGVVKYDTASLNPFTQVFCAQLYTYDKKYVEWLDESGASSLQAENERFREALEAIINNEGSSCQRCEGNGKLWADGKAHLPSYDGPLINCGECGGSGRIHEDLQDIAAEALNKQ